MAESFAALLARLVRGLERQTQRAVNAVFGLVADLRGDLAARLADAKGFELQRLTELQDHITSAAQRFSTDMHATVQAGQAAAITGGMALVDLPLAQVELPFATNDITTMLLHRVSEQTGSLITNISENLRRDITREVQLGALGIKSPFESLTSIRDLLRTEGATGPQGYAARAEAITRTEIGRAQSEATQARMEQAARDVPTLRKQWRHSGVGMPPRPTHVAASGQVREVNALYSIGGVGMRYPRDGAAGPGETVNCRCVSIPYLA